MKTLIPILLLLCQGWVAAEEPSSAIRKAEAYRTTESETWQELEKQIVSVKNLGQSTFEDVIRICRSAQTKRPEEGGIVFADAPPELAGRKIDFEWSKLRTTEIEVSGLIGRAVENRKATLVQEGKKVLFKPIDYAVTESDTSLDPKEVETKGILERRIIPRVDFQNTTLSEAVDFLRMSNVDFDMLETQKKPPMLIVGQELGKAKINKLYLRNVTLWNLLHVLAEEAKAEVDIVEDIVVFHPRGSKVPDFRAKEGTPEARIKEWLDQRILPRVDFEEVTLVEALDFMRMRDAELFPEAAEQSERIDLLIAPELHEHRIDELRIKNVSEWKLIKLFAIKSGLEVEFGENFVKFVEASAPPLEIDSPSALDAVEAKGSPLMANLRWIVAGGVACVVGFSFWMTRRMARA